MGSELGYSYDYEFSMVDEDEIQSKHKSLEQNDDGLKTFLFDIRTDFQLVPGDGDEPILIDSERFDVSVGEGLCRLERYVATRSESNHSPEDRTVFPLFKATAFRLTEYWMNSSEILSFCHAAIGFAKGMAAHPRSDSLSLIPVVVSFQVCTVQREGESYEAAMDRAICSKKLFPLHLWDYPTITDGECCKPMSFYLKTRLILLRRTRNDRSLVPDWVCHFCSRKNSVEAQITRLEFCGHAFHSHCIFRWLEDHDACPICCLTQY